MKYIIILLSIGLLLSCDSKSKKSSEKSEESAIQYVILSEMARQAAEENCFAPKFAGALVRYFHTNIVAIDAYKNGSFKFRHEIQENDIVMGNSPGYTYSIILRDPEMYSIKMYLFTNSDTGNVCGFGLYNKTLNSIKKIYKPTDFSLQEFDELVLDEWRFVPIR